MGLVINNHMHINNEVPGKKYFPWQQTWLVCMRWAYEETPTKGIPSPSGFDRDPHALYPRQGLRFADPEGTHTIEAMDEGGIDMSVILRRQPRRRRPASIDYDFSWGSQGGGRPTRRPLQKGSLHLVDSTGIPMRSTHDRASDSLIQKEPTRLKRWTRVGSICRLSFPLTMTSRGALNRISRLRRSTSTRHRW